MVPFCNNLQHIFIFLVILRHTLVVSSEIYCEGHAVELQHQHRPFIWLGNGPECHVSTGLCAQFGLEYICSDGVGDNADDPCESGNKIICAAPVSKGLASPTSVNQLKVVSLNILELDFAYDVLFLSFYQYMGQTERTCRIPDTLAQLLPDVDAIVFQEVFIGGCFPNQLDLRDLLMYYGFRYVTPTVGINDDSLLKVENGGVFIASRWPILSFSELIFRASDLTTADFFSSKGVMYAKISKVVDDQEVIYHLFGTHLQAQDGITRQIARETQSIELNSFIEEQGIPALDPVIIAGDFNVNLNVSPPDHAYMVLGNMRATLPTIIGPLRTTFDSTENNLIDSDSTTMQWLDYVVYGNSFLQPQEATLQAFQMRDEEPFLICIDASTGEYVAPLSRDCDMSLDTFFLSDHYGVVGSFIFPM